MKKKENGGNGRGTKEEIFIENIWKFVKFTKYSK